MFVGARLGLAAGTDSPSMLLDILLDVLLDRVGALDQVLHEFN